MEKAQTLGKVFVAVSLIVFGVQHFLYGGFVATLVPAFMPGQLFWAYFVGVAFFAAAAGILYKLLSRPAATMLGVMFFLFVLLLHIPRIIGDSRSGNEWTSGFVALAMCGGSWILASAAPLEEREKADPFLGLGHYFYALGFVAFGVQHFVYAIYKAGLGPPWFQWNAVASGMTGIVLLIGGIAVFAGKNSAAAANVLAALLFLLFLLIYVPRIVGQLHNPAPWTSGFELLALSGCALVLAGSKSKQEKAQA